MQLLINGVPFGEPFDQYENTVDAMYVDHNYGSYTFTPGEYTFTFVVTGKNEAAANYNLSLDAIKLMNKEPSITFTGDRTVQQGHSITVSAQVLGLQPFYATGEYVKWSIDSQAAVNGSNKVVSLQSNGLETTVTGFQPGTARLKLMSTIHANAVGYVQITVSEADVPQATIVSLTPVEAETQVGTAPQLPSTVEALYSDHTIANLPVVWDAIQAAQYAQAGAFMVSGGVPGTELLATAHITVVAVQQPSGGDQDEPSTPSAPVTQTTPTPNMEVTITKEEFQHALEQSVDSTLHFERTQAGEANKVEVILPVALLKEAAASQIKQLTLLLAVPKSRFLFKLLAWKSMRRICKLVSVL